MILDREARLLEDYQIEWEQSQTAPEWLPFVWDCVLFLTQGIIYAGFLMRSVLRPSAAIADAPVWALEARRRIEKAFIEEQKDHVHLRGGMSHGFRYRTKVKPKVDT